jgi:sugar transferase (PEP-CTERM/EpsH1 system associated)
MSMAAPSPAAVPLIAHVVFRFDYGGLENGLVNLVNRLPAARYRHAIVALEGIGEEFRRRLQRPDVTVMSIDKRPGKDLPSYYRMWRTLRRLRPAIVHTRNLGTLDMQLAAVAAGVRRRVHGEHGWSPADPQGLDPGNLRLRRLLHSLPQRYVAMSQDIARWLEQGVGVPAGRIRQLYSGVDTRRFRPDGPLPADLPWPTPDDGTPRPVVVGTVGRLDPIKNHRGLLQAFRAILERHPDWRGRVRLIIAGDGPLRGELAPLAADLGLGDSAWFPGARPDVPDLMRAMDVFVLPSINEGISNTILEAMASGRPVVAGRAGGNPELVVDGLTGALYDPDEEGALASALEKYVQQSDLRRSHGEAARRRVVEQFSLEAMVARYDEFYDEVLGRRRAA